MNLERVPLIATDGFEFYKRVVRRILGPACLYGQVIKTPPWISFESADYTPRALVARST
jgi:hypothetical protein